MQTAACVRLEAESSGRRANLAVVGPGHPHSEIMTIPLSARTNSAVEALFDKQNQTLIKEAVVKLFRDDVPFSADETPDGMERVRFSIIKLIYDNKDNWTMAMSFVKTDWHDLFMSAGFGRNANEHNNWYDHVVRSVG